MDIKTLIAVATGKIPHNYRNGLCPDEPQPESRDQDCQACKILTEAEKDDRFIVEVDGSLIGGVLRQIEAHPCQGHARQQESDEAKQDSPWIDPNDKTQKQFLPWVGEKVFFCHAGMTYYGRHTGGSFQSFNPPKRFDTWSCRWMYPPKAAEKIQQTEAEG